ncbi:hypothetical protein GCM10010252_77710 [Streptomyces aureoverticillatus]|nr:hypothetical protein GCM10010252_77710 [Streptomyces aureoverticillatus]
MDRAGGDSALLRIERGQVTEEELAALTAVLGALLARGAHPGTPGTGGGRPHDSGNGNNGSGGGAGCGGGPGGGGCRPGPAGSGAYRAPDSWQCAPGGDRR